MSSNATKTATIPAAAALSGEVELGPYERGAILMPAAWDAAALTFQGGDEAGGTFGDIYDGESGASAEVSVDAAAGQVVPIPAEVMALNIVKVRSGTSAVPVNQAAERVLTLILKA